MQAFVSFVVCLQVARELSCYPCFRVCGSPGVPLGHTWSCLPRRLCRVHPVSFFPAAFSKAFLGLPFARVAPSLFRTVASAFPSHASRPSPFCTARSSVRVVPTLFRTVASVFPLHASHPSPSCTASVLRSRRSLPLSYGSVFRSRFLFVVFFPCSPFIFRFFAPPLCLCFY